MTRLHKRIAEVVPFVYVVYRKVSPLEPAYFWSGPTEFGHISGYRAEDKSINNFFATLEEYYRDWADGKEVESVIENSAEWVETNTIPTKWMM